MDNKSKKEVDNTNKKHYTIEDLLNKFKNKETAKKKKKRC